MSDVFREVSDSGNAALDLVVGVTDDPAIVTTSHPRLSMFCPSRFLKTQAWASFLFSLSLVSPAWATLSFCATNNLTHEAYFFEEDSYMGIGWTARRGERGCDDFEKFVVANGYQWTRTPHKIEGLLGLSLLALGVAARLKRRRGVTSKSSE